MEARAGNSILDFETLFSGFRELLNGSGLRVGQRLQSRLGQSGAVRELNLVQIVVEVLAIRGGLPSTWPFEPVFGWRGRNVLRHYRHGLFFGTACYKLYIVEIMVCSWHSWIYSTPFLRTPTFSWPLMSLRPARDMSLGRWFLMACFSSVKNRNVSGPHLFASFTTRQRNPFATPRTVLQRANKSFCNRSQFRTLFLPHRFIKIRLSHQRPVSIEFLTISQIPKFPKSEKNRKSCGNVRIWRKRAAVRRNERTITIRVLGWGWAAD